MPKAAALLLFSLLYSASAFPLGHSKRVAEIDEYCAQLGQAATLSGPFVFSGPDPWVQLDEVPAQMPDEALALVYTAGPDVRWVYLRIVDLNKGWAEDVNYYFQQNGDIVKRVREVQSPASNVSLQVITYYDHGRVLREHSHHHALGQGHEHIAVFEDPDAPEFWSVEDLPFPDIDDLWRRFA